MKKEFYGLVYQVDKSILFIILSYGNIIKLLIENSFYDQHSGIMHLPVMEINVI